MVLQVVDANPIDRRILPSEPASREYRNDISWDRENYSTSLYTLVGATVTFTTNNGYYWCKIRSVAKNRSSSFSGSVEDGGTVTILVPDDYLEGSTSDTIEVYLRRAPTYGVYYNNIRMNVSYEVNASPSTITVAPAIAGEPQTVNITNTESSVWHKVTWSYGSDTGYAVYGGIISSMDALHLNGNVELWNRPRISAEDMIAAGYTDFDPDSYATLYSMTYTTAGDTFTVLMTPIVSDGSVYSQSDLDDYFDQITAGVSTVDDIIAADASGDGLVIHAMSGEHIDDMDVIAIECHTLSEQWENAKDTYGARTRADVVAHAVSSGPISFGAATRSPAWAVPSASLPPLFSLCSNTNMIPTCVSVETFTEDNTSVGVVSVTGNYLSIPNNSDTAPTVTIGLTKTQDEVGTASGVDYLQFHTTLHITPSGTGKYGATIQSVAIRTPDGTFAAGNVVATDVLIKQSGSYPIQATVVDSRGFSTTAVYTPEITVTAYVAPVITSLTVVRCLQDGTPNDEGGYASITATANKTASGWTYAIVQTGHTQIIYSGSLTDGSGLVGGALDKDVGYTVTVTATCEYSQTATASANIATALYTIHRMAGGKGVAFGQIANRIGVEVFEEWPFYTHGKEIEELIVEMAHPVGSVIQTIDDGFDPNALWPWLHWAKTSILNLSPAINVNVWVRTQ